MEFEEQPCLYSIGGREIIMMRMEYNRYIAYLKAANYVVGSTKVVIREFKREKRQGDRSVTFGVEVGGNPVEDVGAALDLAKVIKRAARIAEMLNTLGICYYYNDSEAIYDREMEEAIDEYKGIITDYMTRVEETMGA